MFASVNVVEEQLTRYIKDYADDQCCLLELLRFLGKHPFTRFSQLAIVHALKNQGVLVSRGLKYLIENELVTEEIENSIHLFSLTTTEQGQSWTLELGQMDWYQWQSLLKRVTISNDRMAF
jgi:hypothetical protein